MSQDIHVSSRVSSRVASLRHWYRRPLGNLLAEAELAALEQLLERSGGSCYDEVGWLESEIRIAKEYLHS